MQTKCAGVGLGLSMYARIGNTPLIRLDKVIRDIKGVTLLAKAEWVNPGAV